MRTTNVMVAKRARVIPEAIRPKIICPRPGYTSPERSIPLVEAFICLYVVFDLKKHTIYSYKYQR
jgi:hypothetical protein